MEAIEKHPQPKTQDFSIFLEAFQYYAILQKTSQNKQTGWENFWMKRQNVVGRIMVRVTSILCLGKKFLRRKNKKSTESFNTESEATLWQIPLDIYFKRMTVASWYLVDVEKQFAIGEIEVVGVVWVPECSSYNIYGTPVKIYRER